MTPTREQLATVYNTTNALLKEKEQDGKAQMVTKWEIVERILDMEHLLVDECMKVLADKNVFTLRKTVNHIPILLPK